MIRNAAEFILIAAPVSLALLIILDFIFFTILKRK